MVGEVSRGLPVPSPVKGQLGVPAAPLLNRLPAKAPGKRAEEGPGARAPCPRVRCSCCWCLQPAAAGRGRFLKSPGFRSRVPATHCTQVPDSSKQRNGMQVPSSPPLRGRGCGSGGCPWASEGDWLPGAQGPSQGRRPGGGWWQEQEWVPHGGALTGITRTPGWAAPSLAQAPRGTTAGLRCGASTEDRKCRL